LRILDGLILSRAVNFTGEVKIRILFGVGGDFLGQWLPVCIAKALPGVECRFVGRLWSDGYFVRRQGFVYRSMSWRSPHETQALSFPNLTDLQIRGIKHSEAPPAVINALGSLKNLIETEIEDFQPDAVVYLTAESAIGYFLDAVSRAKDILPIGLQTSFLPNRLLVHSDGRLWWEKLRDSDIDIAPTTHIERLLGNESPGVSSRFDRVARKSVVWMCRLERIARLIFGAPSLDSFSRMFSLLPSIRSRQCGDFPDLGTPYVTDQILDRFVLVAIHRPVVDVGQPSWIELLGFALAAVPKEMVIVVRPHPDEPGEPLPNDLLIALRERGARVSRPRVGLSLEQLLERASAVLTLSSSVGMQAIKMGVPAVTLAPAFYARPGMGWAVNFREPQLVHALLARGGLPRPDVAAVKAFVRWIEESRSVTLPPISDGVVVASALAERIRLLIGRQR
jgi:hypothetical protein